MSEKFPTRDDESKPGPVAPGGDLETHPLLERLSAMNVDPGDTITLVGYLDMRDPQDDGGQARIYLDLGFRCYILVAKERILYVEPADPSDETQPTSVVLDADASITFAETFDSSYLKGAIASGNPLNAAALRKVLEWQRGPTRPRPLCVNPTPPPPPPPTHPGRSHSPIYIIQDHVRTSAP